LLHLLRRGRDVDPRDRRLPLGRLQQPAQHPDRGRLPRTVRSEQAEDLTLLDAELELPDGRQGSEPPGEVAGLDRSLRHGKRVSSSVSGIPAVRRSTAYTLTGFTL